MDDILTEFISHTKADAALAHDLLESTGWNLEEALTLYDSVMQTHDVKTEEWIGKEGGREGGMERGKQGRRDGGREGRGGCEGER